MRNGNFITKQAIADVAALTGLSMTDVDSVVGFYSLYHEKPEGRYRLQVCTDMPCALRGAEEFLQKLCANVGIKVGQTTPDGMILIEEVTCLAGCKNAPLFQVQTVEGLHYYEGTPGQPLTVDRAVSILEGLKGK